MQDQLDRGVTVVYVKLSNVAIELMHPLGVKSKLANFLDKNPKGGIHHLCLAVSLKHLVILYLEIKCFLPRLYFKTTNVVYRLLLLTIIDKLPRFSHNSLFPSPICFEIFGELKLSKY